MIDLFSNTWFVAWYAVTCITLLYIQLNVFKIDLQYGLDVSAPLFLWGMFWVFCPFLNVAGLLLWIYVIVQQHKEELKCTK